jgi:hypothetical protein
VQVVDQQQINSQCGGQKLSGPSCAASNVRDRQARSIRISHVALFYNKTVENPLKTLDFANPKNFRSIEKPMKNLTVRNQSVAPVVHT